MCQSVQDSATIFALNNHVFLKNPGEENQNDVQSFVFIYMFTISSVFGSSWCSELSSWVIFPQTDGVSGITCEDMLASNFSVLVYLKMSLALCF